jgi:GTP-binding protein
VVADVPGLIEGASEGRGLGDKFLKHIRRTKILVHLIDINEMHLADNYFIIINELKKFDKTLSHKPQIVVLNKIDTVDAETVTMITKQFCKETKLKQKDVHAISSVSGKGVDALMYVIKDTLKEYEVEEDVFADKEYKIYTPGSENDNPKKFTVEKEGDLYRVKGKRVEQIAIMTDEKNEQAMMRLYDVLKKMRIIVELEKLGIKNGERIIVEEKELIYNDFL